ncbi:MAG: 3-phosphoserine/phosphohydroxythreonine transaminase [Flavobacteriales bacterium]|nr:3-phosphoserine/phosphohydroxythreonine transaminase [Flavobacteriales bacterium]MDG1439929.1 3-phosphoserine/phosphohydroxythreonine transaminase [Flavobacteriales bacterium]MDG1797191.1 3-phosphoserine/phosphohydroxythreonine transaminase [Flavobacteriales bacterium]
MKKIHNFSAGPCILPQEVFQKSSESIIDFKNSGLSLIEISHRSKDFVDVMEKARSLVKDILNIPSTHDVLFLQGGASLGFLMAAYNLMAENKTGGYLVTGAWAKKAAKEASFMGNSVIVGSSEDKNFNYIPKNLNIENNLDYLHVTSNNTIFGTQIKEFYNGNIPLACDMSSDIFSRKIDVSNFDLIYAGAQKNMGPAGTTLYIFNKKILGNSSVPIPTMLDLKTHFDKDSMFNTPPVFAVYASMLTLEWLKNNGGLNVIEKQNSKKANLLYNEIDRSSLFKGTANLEDRSTMNVTFTLENKDLNEHFNNMLANANINGLKGHRSVGGFRASMYNALPLESVEVLVDVMKNLETKKG